MKKSIKKYVKDVIIGIVVAVFVFYLQPALNSLSKSAINLAISLNVGVGNYMAQLTASDNPYLSIDYQLYLTLLMFIFLGIFLFRT